MRTSFPPRVPLCALRQSVQTYTIVFFKSSHVDQQTLHRACARRFTLYNCSRNAGGSAWFDCLSSLNGLAVHTKRVPRAQWIRSSLHAILVSYHFDRAAPMTAVEHDNRIEVFQQLSAIKVMQSSRVSRTIEIDSTGSVPRNHTPRRAVVVVAVRISQGGAVCFIDFA